VCGSYGRPGNDAGQKALAQVHKALIEAGPVSLCPDDASYLVVFVARALQLQNCG